ncbi:MAG: M20 family peptidase [Alphaproteobacteria bacterium]|nr:M20 family peptidase [Alphaproteobacteria bacterium]
MSAELKKQVCDIIDDMADELVDASHAIHAKPEIAFEEKFAHGLLTDKVEAAGLSVERHACGLDTAFISSFGDGDREVGILSEYDALPGIGHACGHNIIATTGLGASLALAKLNGALPGKVRYLGTPAEESGNGKELMARQGAFNGLDAAMMVHPAGIDLITMPSLAVNEVRVTYTGKAAHASAMPFAGVNALDALVTAYQSIAQLRQHIKQSERIHGIFNEAGLAPNIVPDHAVGTFYVRAENGLALAELKARVKNCFEAGALAAGCEVQIDWALGDYLEIKDSWAIAERYQQNAESLGRNFFPLEKMPTSGAGSTDMGNISHRVPSIHPMIACAPPSVVIHNPEFAKWAGSEKGDKAVIDGAKSLAMTAIDVLTDKKMMQQAKDDFAATAEFSAQSIAQAWHGEGGHENGDAALGGCGCC